MTRLPYSSIILCDTEFEHGGVEGNLSKPVCVVARDYLTGQEWRLRWQIRRAPAHCAPHRPSG